MLTSNNNTYNQRQTALWGLAGFEYQKLVGIDLALSFFEENSNHPNEFNIKTELDNVGDLDDLVLQVGNNGPITFYQVKHHYPGTKSSDKYTFTALASSSQDGHEKRVELYSFFESWHQHIKDVFTNYQCVLFSNHQATKNLQDCFNSETQCFSEEFITGKKANDKPINKEKTKKRNQVFNSIKSSIKTFLILTNCIDR